MTVKEQMKYWGIAALVLVLALYFLGNVILPFVLGGAIAYVLDPLADRLERLGLSRAMSVAVIAIVATVIFVLLVLLIIPVLVQQTGSLFTFIGNSVEKTPEAVARLDEWLARNVPILAENNINVADQLRRAADVVQAKGGDLLNTILTSAMSLINVMVLLVVVPVVAVYLLYDWDNMTAKVDELLPRDHVSRIRQIARDIDRTLASFIRGQGLVCLILGIFYAVSLMAVGLQFGLIAGAVAGLLTFIPYVGALVGGALSIGLALFQFWGPLEVDGEMVRQGTDWFRIGMVAGIFALGQFLEGNFLTPKLVGSSVGLHPVWLIFALSVFGTMFGFVGMLVAVPVAACIGVIARHAVESYKDGRLYKGHTDQE
ncbi:AI-2E family transporter [Marivivens donghaensis]|nr:AI-2E family transporter [Marivivens donghaensis]